MVQGLKLAGAAQSEAPTPPSDGPRICGDYELIEEIARGGVGVIYRARQRSLDRVVALKMLLLGPHASPEYVRRFRTEALAAASLQHPNIVAIHEVGVHQGEHYLVMDLVDGPNLADFIKDQPLSTSRAAGYLKIIADAIHYAHQCGILHRDLKPSNVLIDSNDQPRVTDFGLARRIDVDSNLTLTGQVLGSPAYMPPEQANAGRHEVDCRSDIYSLGAMLYHMLAGRPPFVGEGLSQTLDQVFHREPISPRLLNPAVPRDLETICLKCLQKEPGRRYSSGQALAEELGRFLRHEPIHARPASAPEKLGRWCRRKPALASLVILLHLVGALGLGGILWEWRRAERNARAEGMERSHAQALAYTSDMSLAGKRLEAGNLGEVRRLLDRHRPRKHSLLNTSQSTVDLRNWEWRYLWQHSRGGEMLSLGQSQGQIRCLAFSHDDQILATADTFGTIRVWDLFRTKLVASVVAPGIPLFIEFSGDDRELATAGWRHGVRLWDWKPPAALTPGAAPLTGTTVCGCRFSNSELVAMDLNKLSYWRWERSSGREIQHYPVPGDTSLALGPWAIFSPDSRLLATSTNNTILVTDLQSGARLASLTNHPVRAHPLAFSPDARILATGDYDGGLKLWDTASWRELGSAAAHLIITERADFSSDGKRLVTCSFDHTLKLWQVSPFREIGQLRGHLGEVYDVRFSPRGRWLASASADGTVKLWPHEPKATEGEPYKLPPDLGFWSLAPDGQWLLLVFADQTFALWDLKDEGSWAPSPRRPLGTTNVTAALVFTGGHTLALGHSDGRLSLHEIPHQNESLVPTVELSGFDSPVTTLGCSYDGRTLAGQDANRLMKAWALPGGKELANLTRTNHGYYVRVPVSPDGKTMVTADDEGGVEFWSLTGLPPRVLRGGGGESVNSVAFFRDGRRVATCSFDKTARVWDLAAPDQPLMMMYSDLTGFRSLALSPDERRLAVGDDMGRPRKVTVFDLTTGQEIAVLPGHKESIVDVAFWPDGNAIVSVSQDAVCVWRAPTLAQIEAAETAAVGGPQLTVP